MERTLQTVGHVVSAVTSPIRKLVCAILGVGALLALIGVAGTLVFAVVLHVLSPNATVAPLLGIAGLALLGGVGLFAACSLLSAAPSRRR